MTPTEFVDNEAPTFALGELIVVSGPDIVATYTDLLFPARDKIRSLPRNCLDPIDTRMTVKYPSGVVSSKITPTTTRFGAPLKASNQYGGLTLTMLSGANMGQSREIFDYNYTNEVITVTPALPSAPTIGDSFSIEPNPEKAYKFEFLALVNKASGSTPNVVLIGNQFDRTDKYQNPHPNTIEVDVMRDLIYINNVEYVPPDSAHLNYFGARELFLYVKKIYYYDPEETDVNSQVLYITSQLPERP